MTSRCFGLFQQRAGHPRPTWTEWRAMFGGVGVSDAHRILVGFLLTLVIAALNFPAPHQADAAAVVTATEAVAPQVRVITFAHYVNWYTGTNFRDATTLPANGLGAYESRDPNVIAFHKSELLQGGKIPLISWWGKDDRRGNEFLDIFFSVPPLNGEDDIQVSLLYEARGILLGEDDETIDFNQHANRARFVADIIHLDRKYFSNPEYRDKFFKIEGKPVIFVWYSHAFKGPFQSAVSDARGYADFYLIGSNFTLQGNLLDEWQEFIPAFDAISAYGAYDPRFLAEFGGANENYVGQYFNGAALWSQWLEANAPYTDLILPMSFAFDNSKSENKTMDFYMNTYEATYFAERVRTAIECSLARNPIFRKVVPTIIFASFNEHFEGTPLERSTHYRDLARPYSHYDDIYREVFLLPITPQTRMDPARCEALLY